MTNRWENQEEALKFALGHPYTMLDMDMGTGKTRVAIDVAIERKDVCRILVVCPKAVIPVWRENLDKFATGKWNCWDRQKGSVQSKYEDLKAWLDKKPKVVGIKTFVVMNYDIVWRAPMGDYIYRSGSFDMVILDESHRAKAAGSKVSKYLALLGKHTRYKLCLSGTPMANSPLDVYGQYRFLDPTIFGTNHYNFLQAYAIMGGPERRFIVGLKNQKELERRFRSIAYSCKMADVANRLKLPEVIPSIRRDVYLPPKDMKVMKELSREFIAEAGSGVIVVSNVLAKMLRLQQIAAGFCAVLDGISGSGGVEELNSAKYDAFIDLMEDISMQDRVVVFCVFKHDLDTIKHAASKLGRPYMELSGSENSLNEWKKTEGAILATQIQAGAEGIDLTLSNFAVYFTLPHSLALYNQSKARLYRPGQKRPVTFIHLIAKGTIDESMYKSLERKEDIIEAVKSGTFDFGFV